MPTRTTSGTDQVHSLQTVVVLTAPDGRVALRPAGEHLEPFAMPVKSGESPHDAAVRALLAPTGHDAVPGRLLAVDWTAPAPETTGSAEIVHLYGGESTAARHAELEAGGQARFVAPGDLDKVLPPRWSRRLLAALHARVEGTVTELEHGRPRHPGALDRHSVLATRTVAAEGRWMLGYSWDGTPTHVRGWLFAPDGRVLLLHDPATGRTGLPGGAGGEDPMMALGAVAATTAQATLSQDREVFGHHLIGDEATASVAARLRVVGPLVPAPCAPMPIRLLAAPEQARELVPDAAVTHFELQAVMHLAHSEFELPAADRRPVTEIPSTGGVL
ncbi:hypothetical protein OG689_42235 [Kitasatospora sp. NBC_00240]|uniref:hypothetical protein n=1 Tax=Kitasatospora sp. NBC_00240 TaxID=2903567 RepID=UPI00225117D4|nr:hypothetical protein [Kitasatospora sp. NBC_00240]MCX5215775.1 hypothetical protein [Kitasatospora sp. NBC_00240]